MISLRLPRDLEEKLELISAREKRTRTDIIKESLRLYFQTFDQETSAYELGKEYFGKYASGISDKSVNNRSLIRDRIRKNKNG